MIRLKYNQENRDLNLLINNANVSEKGLRSSVLNQNHKHVKTSSNWKCPKLYSKLANKTKMTLICDNLLCSNVVVIYLQILWLLRERYLGHNPTNSWNLTLLLRHWPSKLIIKKQIITKMHGRFGSRNIGEVNTCFIVKHDIEAQLIMRWLPIR